MRFSVNLPCLFPGVPLENALQTIKGCGMDTVEMWGVQTEQAEQLEKLLPETGMRLSALCTSFFILNDKTRRKEYLSALAEAIGLAKRLRCPSIITQVGQDTGAPRERQHEAIAQGLAAAAPMLEKAGVTLLVEPLNDVKDHKGYYLTDSAEGFDLIREVGSPNVRLLYDIYHQALMGEDVCARIRDNAALIGHFHAAGVLELFCKRTSAEALLKQVRPFAD